MNRFLPALGLMYAFAAQAQTAAAEAPVETAGPLAIGLFAVLFFGAIGVFGWMTMRKGRSQRGNPPPSA